MKKGYKAHCAGVRHGKTLEARNAPHNTWRVTTILVSKGLLSEGDIIVNNVQQLRKYCIRNGEKIGLMEYDYVAKVGELTLRCCTEEYLRNFIDITDQGKTIRYVGLEL